MFKVYDKLFNLEDKLYNDCNVLKLGMGILS